MTYIGARPTTNFRVAPVKDTFTGDGSTTTFDLANKVPAGGENALQVFVENVRQEPGSGKAYTLGADGSGDLKRITFSAAPVASAEIYVITTFSNEAFSNLDLNGSELQLDADGDTTVTSDTDDQIDIKIAGADDFQFTANTFTAQTGSSIVVPEGGLTLGSTAVTSTAAELNLLDGVSGLVQADLTKLAAVDSTAAELNLLDGSAKSTSSITVADADALIVIDGSTTKQIPASDIKTYAGGAATIGALTDVNMDGTNFTDSILIQTNTDGSAPTTGTLSDAIGNVGIGKDVFKALTSADYAVGIGYEALDVHLSGSYPIAIGAFALSSSTTSDSIAIGGSALNACDTEQDNLAIGFQAMKLANSGAEDNTVVGNFAGDAITSGDGNTIMGHHSGGVLTSGADNTIIGQNAHSTLTTGSSCVALGSGVNVSASDALRQIAIGHNVTTSANDQFRFGQGSTDAVYNQFATNASWTRASDERIKKDIKTNEDCGLDFINDLRTVTFKKRAPSELPEDFKDYDADDHEPKHTEKLYGMIAQEVKTALDKHKITDFGGWHEDELTGQQGLSQEMFVYPLIKAIQELSTKVTELEKKLEDK